MWTQDKPNKPGYYWAFDAVIDEVEMAIVQGGRGKVLGERQGVELVNWQWWYGPIGRPDKPTAPGEEQPMA